MWLAVAHGKDELMGHRTLAIMCSAWTSWCDAYLLRYVASTQTSSSGSGEAFMSSDGEGDGEASCFMENGAAMAATKRETNTKTKARDLKNESAILECLGSRVIVVRAKCDLSLTGFEIER